MTNPSALVNTANADIQQRWLSARDQRTYLVSDERLRAFAQLTPLQRLQWVEQCSHFVRLGQQARQAERARSAER